MSKKAAGPRDGTVLAPVGHTQDQEPEEPKASTSLSRLLTVTVSPPTGDEAEREREAVLGPWNHLKWEMRAMLNADWSPSLSTPLDSAALCSWVLRDGRRHC